ncbi:MAG TPA: hypothetical protein VKA78_00890, partial [Pyrinomonadaceae bacterium]|nr:hypothetical protein [Pyrinomonadaceae bacterium]
CRKVGTGGGAPNASNGPGVGVGEALGREAGLRAVVRFCALVTNAYGNKKSAARVNSSTNIRNLILLMQII